jgi:hypothetical protein
MSEFIISSIPSEDSYPDEAAAAEFLKEVVESNSFSLSDAINIVSQLTPDKYEAQKLVNKLVYLGHVRAV